MDRRLRLSACVLTLNERGNIGPCIESLRFAGEILVLDSGSTDGTAELCRALGCRVETRTFTDYADQRNAAAGLATYDWVLFVDADERVTPELRGAIEAVLALGPGSEIAFTLRRCNRYFGRWLRFGAWEPDLVVRLYDRRSGRWEGAVHERLRLQGGRPRLLAGALEHHSFRDLTDQVDRLNRYSSLADGSDHWLALHMLIRPPAKFFRAYVLKGGFLEGRVGLVQAILSAFATFLKYAKRLERSLQQEER